MLPQVQRKLRFLNKGSAAARLLGIKQYKWIITQSYRLLGVSKRKKVRRSEERAGEEPKRLLDALVLQWM
jgi:hypothetical protein